MTVDAALPFACMPLQAALLALLISKGMGRALPVFVAYQGWSPIYSVAGIAAIHFYPALYSRTWIAITAIDTLFFLCVLVEVSGNILRHNRAPRSRWPGAALFLLIVAPLFWSLASWPDLSRFGGILRWVALVMQATAVLQIAGLVTTILWSSLKKLRWPERELQVVTGMSVWALVQFAVLILHTHGLTGPRYHWLDLLTPIAVLVVLIYWLHYFWFEPDKTPMRAPALPAGSSAAGPRDRRDCRGLLLRFMPFRLLPNPTKGP